MGAWGPGTLDNDAALDFLEEFAFVGVPALRDVFTEAGETPEDDVLDEEVASFALAGGEVVATAFGHPPRGEYVPMDLLTAHRTQVAASEGLRGEARAAARRVVGDNSGLLELWEEAGASEVARFEAAVADLIARLEETA